MQIQATAYLCQSSLLQVPAALRMEAASAISVSSALFRKVGGTTQSP